MALFGADVFPECGIQTNHGMVDDDTYRQTAPTSLRNPVEVWAWPWRGKNELGVVHFHRMSGRYALIALGYAVAPNETEHRKLRRSDTGLYIEIRKYRQQEKSLLGPEAP